MTKDRLAALKPIGDDDTELSEITVIPSQPHVNGDVRDEDESIDKFFQQVEDIRAQITLIGESVRKVKTKHGEILADPNSDDALKKALEDLMLDIKKRSNKVRANLTLLKQELEKEENSRDTAVVSAHFRIKQTQCNTLSRSFVDVMNDYNQCQVTHRQKCKDRIKRQLDITGRSTTDEALEKMLESENPQIFTQGIQMDTQAAKKSLADIEARHEDIIKLENSIRELHDMFLDMAMLVESQGEMVDRIEYNVVKSAEYVSEAKASTTKALKFQSAARRKKVICFAVLAAIIVVVLIIIIVPTVLNTTKVEVKDSSASNSGNSATGDTSSTG